MQKFMLVTVLLLLFGCSHLPPKPEFTSYPELKDVSYVPRLNAQDELEIRLDEDPEYNQKVIIGDDGDIDIPLAGQITARGLSRAELRDAIQKRIIERGYHVNPHISVNIGTMRRPPNVVVVGAVNRARVLPYHADLGLYEALGGADGLRGPIGYERPIMIIRNPLDKPMIFQYDLERAFKFSTPVPRLLPGDVVIAQGSVYDDVERAVNVARNIALATSAPVSTVREMEILINE